MSIIVDREAELERLSEMMSEKEKAIMEKSEFQKKNYGKELSFGRELERPKFNKLDGGDKVSLKTREKKVF